MPRSRIPEPEIIEGLGQFKAGWGAIVTEWHNTRKEAIAAYWRAAKSSATDKD